MGKPAARVTDLHVCPKKTGKIPHVGGPIVTGSPDVLIGGLPAARVGDTVACVGPPDKVASGSSGVLINNKPAARLGDSTAHGGTIVGGCPTVLIGDSGGGKTLSQGARDVMNAHKAQMRARVEAAEQKAAAMAGATSPDAAPEGANVTAAVADVDSFSGVTADALKKAAESGTAFIEIPPDALINDPPLESVPIIPFEAAAQVVADAVNTVMAEGLSAVATGGVILDAVVAKVGKILPLDAIKNAIKNSRSPSEALGKAGMEQAKKRQGLQTDKNYTDRYHGPDDLVRDKNRRLGEIEAKGNNRDSTAVATNKSNEKQGSVRKNKRRAEQMTRRSKRKKIGISSKRQGGAYTQNEIDLWKEIEDLKGDKRHLSVHTNTETGRVRVFEQDDDGNIDHILDDFQMENFEEIKQGIMEAFKQ